MPFKDDRLFSSIAQYSMCMANANHEIVQYWLENKKQIDASRELSDYFTSFYRTFENGLHHYGTEYIKDSPLFRVSYLNDFLLEINKLTGQSFEVKLDDFPTWIQEKISI